MAISVNNEGPALVLPGLTMKANPLSLRPETPAERPPVDEDSATARADHVKGALRGAAGADP